MDAQIIFETMEREGFMPAIGKHFGVGARIEVPFTKEACETCIEDVPGLSIRGYNCLKRQCIHTVSKLIEVVNEDGLRKIRGLGEKTRAEINVALYEFGYFKLSTQEKKEFVRNMIKINNAPQED